ncbi:Protocadherin gamma-A3 [Tupaia chinensis]|uniref:Protocadherin gamma-A3 n=1 Tax=Tupaia chinensis TaxID=246437 RepID=L9JU80_TUPCH|nr:Protocadherin gamma-A3 [Tupaia chinensis]
MCETGSGQIRYSVSEELDKGSFVGNIAQDLGLEPPELAQRGVRIVSRGRTQLFALNPRSGSLVTAGRIDREELCAQSARCLVSFNILVEDKLKIFEVEIEIKDINDNAPKFPIEELEIKISELTVPGTRFPLKTAFDPDVGMNSLQNYKLSSNDYFSLTVNSISDGAKYPELVLERALDREEKEVHQLVLVATDGGDPVRSGNLGIRVIVLDANDNPPVFTQPEYSVSVLESVPVGTRLLTVNATDPDEGFNAQVSYILDKMPGKIAQVFHLNPKTGDITILKSLDYEDAMFYEIKIEAQDGPGLFSIAKILVTVLDVNDNAPEITITSLTGSVLEEATAGREIALINVHDRDSGQNGQVTVFIPENLPFRLEKSVGQYYRLVTARSLDREEMSEYNISLRATDRGSPPLSTETHITLQVADINDNPPSFSHSSYSAYIPENNPRGASIFSVKAQDPDSDDNARITYSLTEDTLQGAPLSSYISINSNTGVLYALRSFDYEQFRDLQLLVTASDSGDPPLSSNVSLRLFVLDQNDNAPEVLYPGLPTDDSTGVELAPRSAEPGYLVTKVVAVDKDSGQNAWLSYRLLKASEPGLFMVGLHTGEVRTARALLDRDALKQSLVVAVQDHGQPPLSATVTLTVAVADSIPDVLADLGSIKTLADPGDSGLTLYLVVAVAVVSCVFLAFVIVLLALRLRRWHSSRLLQAAGGGLAGMPTSHFVGVDGPNYADTLISQESCEKSEPLLLSQDLLENKGDPKLLQQIYYSIPEELAKGSRVGNLAKDLGLSVQELPVRKLRVSVEDYFNVSAESGDLLVSGRIDREKICARKAECALEFETFTENPMSVFHVTVKIQDINDNAPHFIAKSIDLEICESALPGVKFPLDSAQDADVEANSLKMYTINSNQYFSLSTKESPDGSKYPELLLEKPLDREHQTSHRLILTAVDGGDPPLSGTTQIQIQVTDANDNAPVFSQDIYRVSLRENVPQGTFALQVMATDQDEGVNAEITYAFLNAPTSTSLIFILNPNTGAITTNGTLDFEETSRYMLGVEARDGGVHTAHCNVQIEIVDENDNAPEVTFMSSTNQIPEDSELGTIIALIKVQDQDSGQNGLVTCHIQEAVPFKLESTSKNYYKLVIDRRLNREETAEYNVTITAIDRGKPPLSSRTSITLHIADVNDNAPIFHQASYIVHVAENNSPGISIAQVSASDPDLGPNGSVSYSIIASDLDPKELSSYVSVSSHSGVVFAQRAFDYEQLRTFQLTLQARDQGSPALSANVSLRLLVGDLNDNAPRVLYPALGPDGSALFDMVPRAAEPGYLVTKVVAVDADSGHNAWLSYHVLQASDPGLFSLTRPDSACWWLCEMEGGHPSPPPPRCTWSSLIACKSWLVGISVLLGSLWEIRTEQIRYSVPEELDKGSFVGNIAKDLGLEPRELAERGVRIVSRGRTQLFDLNPRSGSLVTAGRIDREELCDRSPKCVANLEILLEDKVKIFGVEVEIIDVNDNAPSFGTEQREIKVSESENPGTRFPLPEAFDLDVGVNSLQGYQLSTNGHFSLDVQSGSDGIKYPELVLEQALDREEEAAHHLVLTAFDGGHPVLSGTARIHITLVDTNDNAPVFTRPEYHVSVQENVPVGTRLLNIKATDPDEGANGEVTYSFRKVRDKISQLFHLDSLTGDITVLGDLDYEDSGFYDIDVEAHDGPGLRARSKVLVTVLDDHGQPPLSATVTLTVAIADSIPDVLADLGSLKPSADQDDSGLTLYLVVAIATVSCVFLAFVIVLLALRLRRWHSSRLLQAASGRLTSVPASHFVGVDGVRAFLQTYSHEVSLTADSRNLIFPQPNYADTLISQESCEKSEPLLVTQDLLETKGDPNLLQVSQSYNRPYQTERRTELCKCL